MTHIRIPGPFWLLLSRARSYARRLGIWLHVAREVNGHSAYDRRILRRALIWAPIDALKHLDEWRDPQLHRDCMVSTSLGRFTVRKSSDELYLVLPSREPSVLATIRNLLRPGDCFVDAGANIGAYTIAASRLVGDEGRVIAIEMMPETAEILRRHAEQNRCGNVEVIEAALSDVDGQSACATVEAGKHGSASIAVRRPAGRQIMVPTLTLGKLLAEAGPIRLIKMDLEGADLAAARGLGPVLDRVEAVLFESWGNSEIDDWFRVRGYEVRKLDGNNSLAMSASSIG